MLDSNLINPKETIAETFGLILPNKQSECQTRIRNLFPRRHDESRAKRLNPGETSDQPDDLAIENQRLRRCIDDLISHLYPDGAWRASEPTEILFDVRQALRLSDRRR